ncbi:hypothetical protein H0H87_010384 [Tephrocybe sp. NHM501043]|nr:hypothetical protein H0H87_010384 [Tephrocybe sp. NHM501043]
MVGGVEQEEIWRKKALQSNVAEIWFGLRTPAHVHQQRQGYQTSDPTLSFSSSSLSQQPITRTSALYPHPSRAVMPMPLPAPPPPQQPAPQTYYPGPLCPPPPVPVLFIPPPPAQPHQPPHQLPQPQPPWAQARSKRQ